MSDTDKIIDIYRNLKSNLEKTGLVVDNTGVSNLIILALSEAFDEGIEKGKKIGLNNVIEALKEM
ncbi:hypothetical protein [Bacillus sp. T33-2]|uniref:hypothetical protein n=1 Tax=Bacillus sp. T33-2 TaxID=2054168 RepID=UPI000C785B72|nr:hypothetical protein [Bacillus sp. T33-2]PLR99574.1 hypothetical protein CVD19_00490 [Bacillus sp. T33-2]